MGPHGGCLGGLRAGASRSAGRCWTSRGPIGPRSTPPYPTRTRSRTRSMSSGWATPRSTRSAAGSRTRPWAIAATNTTRCIGPASCWCQRLRPSPTTAASGCGACSTQATPTARSATPGTPKRPCAASMTSPTPKWAPRPSPSSRRTCRTPPCLLRSTGWAAPSGAGAPRSPTGTPPGSPTQPPRRPTISSNGSNGPRSGSPTSPTTASAPCSTPASPTGRCLTPSLRPATRRAAKLRSEPAMLEGRNRTTHSPGTPLRSMRRSTETPGWRAGR